MNIDTKAYIEAFESLCVAAAQGECEAAFVLWEMYAFGLGIRRNSTKAAKWKLKAAKLGHANAQIMIGRQHYLEAVELFFKAEQQDNTDALLQVAKQRYYEAASWYRKAAEQGNTDAQLWLGNMHYYCGGVFSDYEEAASWSINAAELLK